MRTQVCTRATSSVVSTLHLECSRLSLACLQKWSGWAVAVDRSLGTGGRDRRARARVARARFPDSSRHRHAVADAAAVGDAVGRRGIAAEFTPRPLVAVEPGRAPAVAPGGTAPHGPLTTPGNPPPGTFTASGARQRCRHPRPSRVSHRKRRSSGAVWLVVPGRHRGISEGSGSQTSTRCCARRA